MARVGVSITKETAFRDNTQEFSNVYYYDNGAGAAPSAAQADALIDAIAAQEKTWHANNVTFTFGRCWTAGGGAGANEMISQKTLTGVGALSNVASMDKERAFLFRWRAGNDSRGHAVYLRKWYHSQGPIPGTSAANVSATLTNQTGFTTGDRSAMALTISVVTTQSAGGGGWQLVAKSGRQPSVAVPEAHKYLEHHQLGDQWRGA